MDPVDDAHLRRLVAAAAEGDGVALTGLVRATQPFIWRICSALGSSGEVADLVQETYLRAVRAVPSYRGEAPVTAWLAAIARRVCADDVRVRQRRRRLLDRLRVATGDDHVPAPQHVGDALDGLSPQRREAFVLTQVAGLSYEEAAAVVGCPIGTIRSRVARARSDLAAGWGAAETA